MERSKRMLKADGLLLLTALIWGSAFVAQRSGMRVIGPFAFSAARFAVGTLALLPLLVLSRWRAARKGAERNPRHLGPGPKLAAAALAGAVLFTAANLQQVGLVSTTAGNAGFITSLYVILVPIIGFLLGRSSGPRIWIGAILAVAGLYILSVGSDFTMAPGDLLQVIGAGFWACHILLINRLVTRMEALEIAVGQFAVCALLSYAAALLREPAPFAGLLPAAVPILYGGLLSIGVAYTLQIVAQKTAHPAHASIILSMEALIASVAGVLVLGEPVTLRLAAGGALMLGGVVISQLEPRPLEASPAGDGLAGEQMEIISIDIAIK